MYLYVYTHINIHIFIYICIRTVVVISVLRVESVGTAAQASSRENLMALSPQQSIPSLSTSPTVMAVNSIKRQSKRKH